MKITINPKPITKENFSKFGDMITTANIKPIEINDGYAKRFDGIANLNTSQDNGETIISIFSALKRTFPMKIDMMEKHPLGSQAFIPMKQTTFLVLVAPEGNKPDLNKIEAFIIPQEIGVNYNPGTWHFPLIATEDMNFLVVDRKGSGDNLVIENIEKEEVILKYYNPPH
jgi:ureidoglycolate lyase